MPPTDQHSSFWPPTIQRATPSLSFYVAAPCPWHEGSSSPSSPFGWAHHVRAVWEEIEKWWSASEMTAAVSRDLTLCKENMDSQAYISCPFLLRLPMVEEQRRGLEDFIMKYVRWRAYIDMSIYLSIYLFINIHMLIQVYKHIFMHADLAVVHLIPFLSFFLCFIHALSCTLIFALQGCLCP